MGKRCITSRFVSAFCSVYPLSWERTKYWMIPTVNQFQWAKLSPEGSNRCHRWAILHAAIYSSRIAYLANVYEERWPEVGRRGVYRRVKKEGRHVASSELRYLVTTCARMRPWGHESAVTAIRVQDIYIVHTDPTTHIRHSVPVTGTFRGELLACTERGMGNFVGHIYFEMDFRVFSFPVWHTPINLQSRRLSSGTALGTANN